MEIKICNKNLNIGKDDYVKLHNDIIKCKNLKDLRKLFTKFNKINDIDRNTYFQGITIYEDFVYIIKNRLNNRIYIGSTSSLVSRMYSYQILDISNKDLLNDIIAKGISNFDIEIIKCDDNREVERSMIIENSNICYNIIHSGKSSIRNKTKKYNIGDLNFSTKDEIKKYIRNLLDSYKIGTDIPKNDSTYELAVNLIQLHPKYDGFLRDSNNIKLSIIKDDQEDAKGIGKWNIFCFEYKRKGKTHKWGFSTNKIISSL